MEGGKTPLVPNLCLDSGPSFPPGSHVERKELWT